MTIIQKTFFALTTFVALSSFDSRHPFLGVDAGYYEESEVECMNKNKKKQKVCVGQKTRQTPSPSGIPICYTDDPNENCEIPYVGGWKWTFGFVKGLAEGVTDPAAIADARTGPEVIVSIDEDKTTCEVRIGDEQCQSCSAEGCDNPGPTEGGTRSVKYDCRNINKGRKSGNKCAPLDQIFYPLKKKTMYYCY